MGGIPETAPALTQEEIIARLIDIGGDGKVPTHHTIWVVENPHADRMELDDILYHRSVEHLEMYKVGRLHAETYHLTYYAYHNKEHAMADALHRLALVGKRCFICHGVAHAASGCQYSETCLVCGTCIQPYSDIMDKVPKAGLPAYLQQWTASKSSKKLKAKFPNAKGFYECAGLFLGQDNRRF